jgi:hypothetical protein
MQTRQRPVPKNIEEANKLFIATQQDVSLSEKARMERIDNVIIIKCRFWVQILIFTKQRPISRG